MRSCSSWLPLITGDAAAALRDVIDAVLLQLDQHKVLGLDNGKALLTGYAAVATGSRRCLENSRRHVTDQIISMQEMSVTPALYGGVAGTAWLSAHLERLLPEQNVDPSGDDDAEYEEIDGFLLALCERGRLRSYDVITGWVGLGVYFLERFPHPAALEGIRRVAGILHDLADQLDDGISWHTASEALPPWQRDLAPTGYRNLGVAHGAPGIVSFLGEVQRLPGRPIDVTQLLSRAARWVLSQQLPNGQMPSWVPTHGNDQTSRVAWCYGELGVSVALLGASRAIGDACIEERAIDMALRCSQRRQNTGIRDAGLCHGAAGNGHLFNRLYQATRDQRFEDAAVYWFEQAVAMRDPEKGIAGYRTWTLGNDRQPRDEPWTDDVTFLSGATGIALAMLAAISPIEPAWDRMLLAGITPIPR